ncbi:MAG: hypothetical protein EAZ16_00955 [Sphingobacteriales bacterium]|nr:MAG: hypothetical protein EAZ16_00955 [Sphingobacteriales bacterium]
MKISYLLLGLFLPVALLAQKKVDLDKFNVAVQYRSLPQYRLDSSYKTYNVEVEGTRLMQPFLKELTPEKSVELEGWRQLERAGHITIKLRFEDILPESVNVKERVETIKNKSGQVTGTRTYYRQEVVYTFAATAVITDYKGLHIEDVEMATRQQKHTYQSAEFANKAVADGYFFVNALNITNDLFKRSVNNAVHNLSNRITTNYGFRKVTGSDIMWVVDSRKHPEYESHRKAFQKINDVLFSMSADKPITGLREELAPAIKYFESIKKNYSSTSKHDRKLRYASYFNLTVLYYYLDDPQAMMNEAKGLRLNDFDAKDATGFEQTAMQLKNLFENNQVYTRHFSIDTTKFKGPFEKDAVTKKTK